MKKLPQSDCTHRVTRVSINPYKLIQTFFVMILKNIFIFFKIRQIIGNKFK